MVFKVVLSLSVFVLVAGGMLVGSLRSGSQKAACINVLWHVPHVCLVLGMFLNASEERR